MAGFGYKDKENTILADEDTLYRVGSITKLFTDMALVIASNEGKIDLNAPVSNYIKDFAPKNPYATAITSRHLMAHTCGLAREPPRGHYMDDDPTLTLHDTVMSLNSTTLFFEPGTVQKYSNSGIAVIGLLLEVLYGKTWDVVVRELILEPLGMTKTEPIVDDRVRGLLARGVMWSQDNRLDRHLPGFEIGEAPAGTMCSTINDLQKFAAMMLNKGRKPDGTVFLSEETVDLLLKPQYTDVDKKGTNYSVSMGWQLSTYAGVDLAGHGGAIYGFTARFVLCPARKFSHVVFIAGDCAIATLKSISNYMIQQHVNYLDGASSFPLRVWSDVPRSTMIAIEGAFKEVGDGKTYEGYGEKKIHRFFHLDHRFGTLFMRSDRGYTRLVLSDTYDVSSSDFVVPKVDASEKKATESYQFEILDRFIDIPSITISSDLSKAEWQGVSYERYVDSNGYEPAPQEEGSEKLLSEMALLCGEYGVDHSPTYIIERHGRLFALLEWAMMYPLRPKAEERDSNGKLISSTWVLPSEDCFYADELIIFLDFNEKGVPQKCECTGMMFDRRLKGVEANETFLVKPVRPMEEIRKEALAVPAPPKELTEGAKKKPELVDMSSFDLQPPFLFDIRYATDNNFVGTAVYKSAKAFAQKPAAECIVKAHKWLNKFGFGLVLFDIYRPWHVTKMFWDATPEDLHHFVANPATGSIHNRGGAIDCGLYDLKTGQQLHMVAGFDEMTPRSYRDYAGTTTKQRWLATLLRTAMQLHQFEIYEYEWWHFNFEYQLDYPVMNESFEKLSGLPD